MDSEDFEQRMRALEYFHSLRVLPGAWIVLRVDGRSFSRFTAQRFQRPFDETFRDYMTQTARALLQELHGLYAYSESDEISVLFPHEWDAFDREVEKLVSISASLAAATFTHACGEIVSFDSRVWVGVDRQDVVDYFRWRMADAERCGLNGWCYWTLRGDGQSIAEATATLHGKTVAYKNELLFQHGINYNDLPAWQRRGVGIYWERYAKTGYDPVRKVETTTTRRKVKVDRDLPMKDAYAAFIGGLLDAAEAEREEELQRRRRKRVERGE